MYVCVRVCVSHMRRDCRNWHVWHHHSYVYDCVIRHVTWLMYVTSLECVTWRVHNRRTKNKFQDWMHESREVTKQRLKYESHFPTQGNLHIWLSVCLFLHDDIYLSFSPSLFLSLSLSMYLAAHVAQLNIQISLFLNDYIYLFLSLILSLSIWMHKSRELTQQRRCTCASRYIKKKREKNMEKRENADAQYIRVYMHTRYVWLYISLSLSLSHDYIYLFLSLSLSLSLSGSTSRANSPSNTLKNKSYVPSQHLNHKSHVPSCAYRHLCLCLCLSPLPWHMWVCECYAKIERERERERERYVCLKIMQRAYSCLSEQEIECVYDCYVQRDMYK